MASLSKQTVTSTPRWNYDVFLSFRGEDTRMNFTDHLYTSLVQKGIRTFRDDEGLVRGKAIAPELLKAIEESRISLVVFSQNYARSKWCLDELVKIIECKKAIGQTVLPIFYNVDPSQVRNQTGSYGQLFLNQKEGSLEKTDKWRAALMAAGSLSGWHLQNGFESQLIKKVTKDIFGKLNRNLLHVDENLVGMDSRWKEMTSRLNAGSNDVRVVGIYGLGGIGKTTITKVVYNLIASQFDASSFLANVREVSKDRGLHHLQNQLLHDILAEGNHTIRNVDEGIQVIKDRLHSKMVLLVLDDVDNLRQLDSLAGNCDWFGPGSRIIITTREKHLLVVHGVNESYEAKVLDYEDSVQLFSRHAFKQNNPKEDYVELSKRAVHYAKGLPLALKILGSVLFSKTVPEWESELFKLEKEPNTEIQNVLRISYDGLDYTQKEIFLDIACFFKWEDTDFVTRILDGCGFYSKSGLRVLSDKCLITILHNKLWMHDLIQQLGLDIVRQECPKEPGKRSRLWDCEDVHRVLTKNTGTETIEGIFLDLSRSKQIHFTTEVFAMMNRLRLLKVFGNSKHYYGKEHYNVHLSDDFEFPSYELRYLHWDGCPLEFLPLSFHAENLVEFNMCYSHIKQLWNGNKILEKLNAINLSYSPHLAKVPNFSSMPNLERVVLEGCTSLLEVHPSIGVLKKLIFLNLKGCKKLRSFPRSLELESLKILILSGCSELKKFPDIQENMGHLSELYLNGTSIKQLPSSFKYLTGLVILDLKNCRSLESLPEITENMGHLTELLLDETAIRELPSSIEHLKRLVILSLRNCEYLSSLPNTLCNLKSLETLILYGCSKLDKLPDNLGSLQCLAELNADGTSIRELPSTIVLLRNLEVLSFHGCKGPSSNSWSSLFKFRLLQRRSLDSIGLQLPSLSGLWSLRELNLSDCNLNEGTLPSDLCCLSSLEELTLSGNNFVSLPEGISRLSNLSYLGLGHCKKLTRIPELPSSIREIDAYDCTSLETLSSPTSLSRLEENNNYLHLKLPNCAKLAENKSCNVLTATLQKFQEYFSTSKLSMVLPGCEIPEWFWHQNMGNSVTIDLPPSWYVDNFVGVAVCSVFSLKDVNRLLNGNILCQVFSDASSIGTFFDSIYWEDCSGGSDHVWVAYQPLHRLSLPKSDSPSNWKHVNAKFKVYGLGADNAVKKCGLRLIYSQNHEENHPAVVQYSSIGNFDDQGSAVEHSGVKRSHDDSESSGSVGQTPKG